MGPAEYMARLAGARGLCRPARGPLCACLRLPPPILVLGWVDGARGWPDRDLLVDGRASEVAVGVRLRSFWSAPALVCRLFLPKR
jgi:hypothetical protein